MAAQYCHPRLANVVVDREGDPPPQVTTINVVACPRGSWVDPRTDELIVPSLPPPDLEWSTTIDDNETKQ